MINVEIELLPHYPKNKGLPFYQTEGSACVDLYAAIGWEDCFRYLGGETALFPTGIKIAIPVGYVGLICSRSGLAVKNDVFVINSPGVIDSDYRDEIEVALHQAKRFPNSQKVFEVKPGDRIAQLMIIPYPKIQFTQVKSLTPSGTRDGGFGSTGV